MAEPAAPRKTRPRSSTLDEAHEVIRALGLRDGEGDPPQGDAGTDSDLEALPEPPTGGAPAEPAPPAGSVPAICPAWKQGHCTGEGWCPKQHPQPGPDDGALPEVKPAAARAALRYGVAQGWILDETARGSVNIQEAVNRVTHAGQAAVALHTRGRHGGPAEGIIVEPSGMVLVLAADMVRGVLHASRVRRACPQWTIQVYTPLRAWPFSTWAVLAVMWHLAPEDAPTGTAEDIARDLHTWPADQDYPWRRPRGGLPVAPAAEGLSLAATLQRHPDKKARHFLQTGTVPATPPDSEWRWDAGVAQPLPGPWTLPLWYLPMGTLAHATQAVKGAFPQPLLPGVALLRSLQAGAAWVRWKEGKGRSSPYFPMVQGQALIHAEGMGTVEWGAIVPGTACRWITAAAPQPMRSPLACHRLLRMVPSVAPEHAFTRDVWKAVLSHTREWLTNPAARYPPGPVLEQLTAPTPGVLHVLHRASALTKQLNDEVLDLALEPLRVLYPQAHIPPAGTSNRLGRLGLQRRVEAAHPGGVVEQWLTLRSPSTAEGHWYLHQLLFQPRAAPEHRRQNPYHTHPERRGAQNYPQPVPPALPPGQGPEALQRAPPLDTATTVQQRGSDDAGGAEPDCTNCGAVAWMAACRHLARDTTGLRQYRPTDRTALACAVAAVTMGPVAAWPAQLLPHVPCHDARPRRPAATHAPTAPLTAEQLYVVAAALLADGGESFVHHHGPAQIAGCIQGPQRDAPDPWHATLRGRTRVWGAGDGTPPPGPKQGEALVLQTAGYQAIIHGHAGGYRSHVLAGGRWTVWHSTARQGAFPPLPHIDWRQGPTQAYYMSADPLPLAVLLHTVSAPNKRQEPWWVNPPTLVWSPDQEEHLRAAWQGDAIRATDVPDLHAGPITHARPAATLAVAQRGQQNPQWVVCMFSPADAHIVVCDPKRLPGPEAVIRVADSTRMIIKALREGEHHALLLQVRLKDNARAARPGVWPAAAHPADLELQLAGPTAVYHWLQAFHNLRWRGKPDRQIGSTHWQTWLQADAQRDAIRGLRPAPATRALDAAAPGRTLAPHTVPLANLPFEPAAEGAIRKSVPLPPARGATEPTKCPLCADKYYTSGAMLEHLAWHAVHAAAPADDKEAAANILQGRARRSPWHAPYTRRPPPQAADHTDGDEEAPGAAPGAGGAAPPGSTSIPAGLAPLAPLAPPVPRAPLWAPLGTGSADAAHPDALAAPANPAAMPMRDS